MSAPLVSIITPSYNSSATIMACLESVALQDYRLIEHIIVDGLSKDNTVSLVTSFQKSNQHVKFISERDKGIYDAMNKGIDLAAGEWLLFLGSDDQLNPGILKRLFENTGAQAWDVIYGNVKHRNAGTEFDNAFTDELLARINIPHQAIFYRKSLFSKFGKFETKYRLFADYAFNLKWFNQTEVKIKFVKEIISVFNESGASSVNFDEAFCRDKLPYLLKNYNLPAAIFTDAARRTIFTQIRNRDLAGAFNNIRILFSQHDASLNRWIFLKECAVIYFQNRASV